MPFVFTLYTVRDKNNDSFQYKSKQKPNEKKMLTDLSTHIVPLRTVFLQK